MYMTTYRRFNNIEFLKEIYKVGSLLTPHGKPGIALYRPILFSYDNKHMNYMTYNTPRHTKLATQNIS